MSAYTTEVRYICEYEAGLTVSTGFDDIDDVVEKSWNKIFKNFAIFDESYRKHLCTKILKHFYTREICAETVALWKFWLNQKMDEIMPYYNQLYNSERIKFDPMIENKLLRTITEENTGDKTGSNNSARQSQNSSSGSDNTSNTGTIADNSVVAQKGTSDISTTTTNSDNTDTTNSATSETSSQVLHSDTPQGTIANIKTNGYLTDATITTENKSGSETANQTSTKNGTSTTKGGTTNDSTADTTKTLNTRIISNSSEKILENISDNGEFSEKNNNIRKYVEEMQGKTSSVTYSKMLEEFRNTFLNIDMMVIMDLKDLFMNIY